MVVIGGTMLMIPGFITDVIGIALLLPPTRSLLTPLVVRNLHSRLAVRAARFSSASTGYDVDSTATDIDQPSTAVMSERTAGKLPDGRVR